MGNAITLKAVRPSEPTIRPIELTVSPCYLPNLDHSWALLRLSFYPMSAPHPPAAFRMQSGCTVGVEYRGLEVHPDGERVADDRNVEAQQQPTGRLAAAKDLGMCSELIVRAKHLTSAFGVCQYTRPAKLLCGANGDFLHFLYVYLDRAGGAVTDKESMAIKIPCVQDSSAGF